MATRLNEHRVRHHDDSKDRVGQLCTALLTTNGDSELTLRFLRDLLSAREMIDLANRWAAARELLLGRSQVATARDLGLSTKTVNDIDRWVHGTFATGGYSEVFRRLASSNRIDQARSE